MLNTILERAWNGGFTTKSNLAKEYATEVAAAVTLGFITTQTSTDAHSNKWLITPKGCQYIFNLKGITYAQ